MRRKRIGRVIGATGAACASLFWGFIAVSALAILLVPPTGLHRLVVIFAVPMGIASATLLTICVHDVIVLARRADVWAPGRVAFVHFVLALLLLYGKGAHAWLAIGALLAVTATQLIAIRLFQITPSKASR